MVEQYISNKRQHPEDYSIKWQKGLNVIMYEQALTCVAISSVTIINLHFHELNSLPEDELKQLVRTSQKALNIIENIDEDVFRHAWAFGSRVIKLCEMSFSEIR